jgi:hypothetical protein
MMKRYYVQIIKWTFIGLAIRLFLMPTTMHGQDLFFINYFPMMLIREGVWDPYGFFCSRLPQFLPYTYYGPVLFIIMALPNFIFFKLFGSASSLIKILDLSIPMMFGPLTTIDYVYAFAGLNLCKNLFLMKIPYLVFDFLIAGILLKLADSEENKIATYKLWMLNVVVLHSVYAIGQFDIITAFFIIAALYAGSRRHPHLVVIMLSLGGATKLFPYNLLLPTCLLLGNNWKKRFYLILTAIVTALFLYLPFVLSSGKAVLGFFMLTRIVSYPGINGKLLSGLCAFLYLLLCVNILKDSKKDNPESRLLDYFLMVLLIGYAAFPTRFRYFVSITPLLALAMPRDRKFRIITYVTISILAFLWLKERGSQMGIFAPVNPLFFVDIPCLHEIIGRYIPLIIIYKILARLVPLMFLIAAWSIWRFKSNKEKALA